MSGEGHDAGEAGGGAAGAYYAGPAGAAVGAYLGGLAGGELDDIASEVFGGGGRPCEEDPFCVLATNVDTWRARCPYADQVDEDIRQSAEWAHWQPIATDPTNPWQPAAVYILNGIRAGAYQACACADGDCGGNAAPSSGGGLGKILVGGGVLAGLVLLARKLGLFR